MSAMHKTAKLLRRHRRRWISALALTRTGGLLAWRTEVSRCRTELGMQIENRVERTKAGVRSFYRYTGKKAA